MRHAAAIMFLVVIGVMSSIGVVSAEKIDCVSTTFRPFTPDDKICIHAFNDPKVEGVACHLSQAQTGGISGGLGFAEDPSRFSIACRQIGPITVSLDSLREREEVFEKNTSIFFKETRVIRMRDIKRNTLIYLVYSTKMVDGSPFNNISTVPIMQWNQPETKK